MRQSFDVQGVQPGHRAVCQLYKHHVKPDLVKGLRGRVIWEPVNPDSRTAMRQLFHGPLLQDFAEQVWLMDPSTDRMVRYVPAAWKIHLKDLFCPLTQGPSGEWSKSTERLTDRQFSDFIEQCFAYGTTDCNVCFTEQTP